MYQNKLTTDQRRKCYAAIHACINQLGLCEETYQHLLMQSGAKLKNDRYSASTLNQKALIDLKNNLQAKTGRPKRTNPPRADHRKRMIGIQSYLNACNLTWGYADGIAKKLYQKQNVKDCTDFELAGVLTAIRKHYERHHAHQ